MQLKTAVQRRLSGAFENVRFEWNAGFSTYNSSLWAARNSLVSTWQTPAFETPLNATVNDLASYTTSMTLSQADALWSDVLMQFGSFQQQLQTSSYLFEGAIVSATSRFNQTGASASCRTPPHRAVRLSGAAQPVPRSPRRAQMWARRRKTRSPQTAMQNIAGTQNQRLISSCGGHLIRTFQWRILTETLMLCDGWYCIVPILHRLAQWHFCALLIFSVIPTVLHLRSFIPSRTPPRKCAVSVLV